MQVSSILAHAGEHEESGEHFSVQMVAVYFTGFSQKILENIARNSTPIQLSSVLYNAMDRILIIIHTQLPQDTGE